MEKREQYAAVVFALLPLGVSLSVLWSGNGAWTDAFWIVLWVLPALGLWAAITGRACFVYAVLTAVLLGSLDLVMGDGLVAVGRWVNAQTGLGAIPEASAAGLLYTGILAVLAASLLRRQTFARIITLVAMVALMGALVVFHLVTINLPLGVLEQTAQAERESVWDGCETCIEGSAHAVQAWAGLHSERLAWTVPSFVEAPVGAGFCWVESFASALQTVCVERSENGVRAVVAPSAHGALITAMQTGFALLALVFINAWTLGVTYVVWRHGPMVRQAGRWRKG